MVNFKYFGNIFHILHDVKNAENVLYTAKGKKSKFNRLQIEVFFLLKMSSPPPSPCIPPTPE